jgi:hypothetical protein
MKYTRLRQQLHYTKCKQVADVLRPNVDLFLCLRKFHRSARGHGGEILCILLQWNVFKFMLASVRRGKRSRHPTDGIICGLQSRSGRGGEVENSCPCREQNLGLPYFSEWGIWFVECCSDLKVNVQRFASLLDASTHEKSTGSRKEVPQVGRIGPEGGSGGVRDLYPSPDIITVIKSRRLKWLGHLTRLG